MDTSPRFYAQRLSNQARVATDDFLVALLTYATSACVAGSCAALIKEAEAEVIVAEFKRRGLKLPFWARGMEKAA